MPKIVYKFVADSSGLTTQLKQVSVQLDQVDDGVNRFGKHGTEAGGKVGAALDSAHHAGRRLGGALSLIDPQLGAMAREAGHFAGGLSLAEGAGASLLIGLGAVSVAVVGLVELWKHFGDEAEAANKRAEDSAADAAKAEIGIFAASDKGFLQAQKHADEANQKLIDLNNQQERIKNNVELSAQTRKLELDTMAKQITAAEEEKAGAESSRDASKAAYEQMTANVDAIHNKKSKAAKEESAQQKALREEAVADLKAANDFFDTVEKQVAAEILKAIDDLEVQSKKEADQRAQLVQAHEDNLKQHGPGGTDSTDAYRANKKQLDDAAASTRAYGEIVAETAGNVSGLANSVGSFANLSAGAQIALAVTTRAAALAQIAAQTGVAIAAATAAAAETGPGFPIALPIYEGLVYANAALAAAAVIAAPIPTHHAGAGEIVAASTRSYHDGAGNIPTTLQAGEGVANRTTMAWLGREGMNNLNRGMRPSQTPSVMAQVVGHRAMDLWYVSSLSRWQSPTRSMLQKVPSGVRPGRRERA